MSQPFPLRIRRLALLFALHFNRDIEAQEKHATEPAHASRAAQVDREGVALPRGAVARFGSMRFRHGGLTDFVFAPDGETVLTAGLDGFVRFWDLKTGKQKSATRFQSARGLACAALSSDAKVLLLEQVANNLSANTRNEDFSFYDVASGRVIKSLRGLAGEIEQRELSPDGGRVAVSNWVTSSSKLAKTVILDCETGQERSAALRYRRRDSKPTNGCFAPNGKWYAVAGNLEETLQVTDFASGQLICELGARDTAGQAFSTDSKLLVISCRAESEPDKKASLRFLKISSGEEIRRVPTDTEFDTLALSHDGKLVAVSGLSGIAGLVPEVSLIEVGSGTVLHRFPGFSHKLQFSPDDKTLAGISSDLRLWDVETGREKLEHAAGFYAQMAGSPDGNLIAAVDRENDVINLWASDRQELIRQIPTDFQARLTNELAFSPDNKAIQIVADARTLFRSWDVATGKENKSARLSRSRVNGSPVTSLIMSPDGLHLAESELVFNQRVSVSTTKRIDIREVNTQKVLHTRSSLENWRRASWMPDGKSMLLKSANDLIFMNVANGAIRSRIQWPSTNWILPSPDGRLVAYEAGQTTKGPVFCISETLTGNELTWLPLERSSINPNLFWADDRTLVSVTDHRIDTWDALTGEIRLRVSTQIENGGVTDEARIVDATLLRDRRHLLTAQFDHTGLLWDLASGLHAAPNSAGKVAESVVTKWWEDLASETPRDAFKAVWQFVDSPDAIPFLLEQVKDHSDVDYSKARDLIVKLDDNHFRVREKAQEELHAMGNRALQAIRDSQGQEPSPEARRRLQSLASRWPAQEISGFTLRRLRAIQILEHVKSGECQKLLIDLAANAPTQAERLEAQAALERLN